MMLRGRIHVHGFLRLPLRLAAVATLVLAIGIAAVLDHQGDQLPHLAQNDAVAMSGFMTDATKPGAQLTTKKRLIRAEHEADQIISIITPSESIFTRFLHVGNEYDFSDSDLDDAATHEMQARSLAFSVDTFRHDACSNSPGAHFFSSNDCWMFTSKEACEHARNEKTYLLSYPCSGNTWTRVVLEATLSIYTGSVFNDGSLRNMGMLGEGIHDPAKVFPIKTHYPILGAHDNGKGVRDLIVIRDPLHSALSYTTLDVVKGNHSGEPPKDELEKAFDKSIKDKLSKWAQMARMAKENRTGTYVVRYEDIISNTRETYLNHILPFLNVNSKDPVIQEHLDCAIRIGNSNFGKTRRSHKYVFKFTDKHKELVGSIIGTELLQHFGYSL